MAAKTNSASAAELSGQIAEQMLALRVLRWEAAPPYAKRAKPRKEKQPRPATKARLKAAASTRGVCLPESLAAILARADGFEVRTDTIWRFFPTSTLGGSGYEVAVARALKQYPNLKERGILIADSPYSASCLWMDAGTREAKDAPVRAWVGGQKRERRFPSLSAYLTDILTRVEQELAGFDNWSEFLDAARDEAAAAAKLRLRTKLERVVAAHLEEVFEADQALIDHCGADRAEAKAAYWLVDLLSTIETDGAEDWVRSYGRSRTKKILELLLLVEGLDTLSEWLEDAAAARSVADRVEAIEAIADVYAPATVARPLARYFCR